MENKTTTGTIFLKPIRGGWAVDMAYTSDAAEVRRLFDCTELPLPLTSRAGVEQAREHVQRCYPLCRVSVMV